MQTRKQDLDAIAEEAIGQRHGDPPPYAVKETPDMSQEEVARRLSKRRSLRRAFRRGAGQKSVGEQVGDAYADPGSPAARNLPGKMARPTLPHQLYEQPFMMVVAGFALGYMTALLLHGRR